MEEIKYSPPFSTSRTTATAADNREQEKSTTLKKDCLAFGVSLLEGFRYVKAILVGQAKKLKARNEKEATEAELQAEKMQVEAADEAENTKEKIYRKLT